MHSDFRARLRDAVRSAGGPEEVALRAGIPRRSLGNYLAGPNEPKMSVLIKLCETLMVRVEWLATGEGPMRPGEEAAPAAAPAPAPAGRPGVDAALMRRVQEGVADVYKSENAKIYQGPLAEEAARVYNELVAACDDPADWQGALKVLLARLRRDLRAPPAAGARGGSQAS